MHPTRIVLFFILLVLVSPCHARQDWLQGWRDATVAIGIADTGKAVSKQSGKYMLKSNGDTVRIPYFKVIGTAILFGSPDTSIQVPLLVTAKHVFDDPKKNWHPSSVRLRFSWFADKSVAEYLGIDFKLKDQSGKNLWRPHVDPNVDLAVIPLLIQAKDAGRPSVIPVRVQNLADTTTAFEGASVLVLGYPGAVGPDYWTKPIVRHGIIAHVDQAHFGTIPFLVDAMIFPGNSGGPVFTVPTGIRRDGSFGVGGGSAFLGVVSAVAKQMIDVEKTSFQLEAVKPDSSPSHFKSFDYMGLGIIEPGQRVRELLGLVVR